MDAYLIKLKRSDYCGTYEEDSRTEVLTKEGVFTNLDKAKARCRELALEKFNELSLIADEENERGSNNAATITIDYDTWETGYDMVHYSWQIELITII